MRFRRTAFAAIVKIVWSSATYRTLLLTCAALSVAACTANRTKQRTHATTTPTSASQSATATTSGTASAETPSAAANAPSAAPSVQSRTIGDAGAVNPTLNVTHVYRRRRFEWRQIGGVNWQPSAQGLPPLPAVSEPSSAECGPAMVLVEGGYLLSANGRDDDDGVLLAQDSTCALWLTKYHTMYGLCDRFDADAWRARAAKLPRKRLRFCIDRYEYPNARGEFPLVVVTYSESVAFCKKAGKRICAEDEWTFACEGEEGRPFPYGYVRDPNACPIDIIAPPPDDDTFLPRTLASTAKGLDFAWQGKRSGESPRCVSPFGVFDLTGNVDEWTKNTRKYGREMIMKGGHWGGGRHRCRPQTRGHGPAYVRYDQGFRCCTDPAS